MSSLTLGQVAKFVKSELTLIILAILSISLFALAIYSYVRKPEQPQLPKTQQTPWQNIFAGTTTKSELLSILGPPIKSETKDDAEIYYYPTENQFRPNTIEFEEDKVSRVKEQILATQNANLSQFIATNGQPEAILYGHYGTIAPGHFWGQLGLLVFAGQNEGIVLEIWYFSPTNLEEFLLTNSNLKTAQPTTF